MSARRRGQGPAHDESLVVENLTVSYRGGGTGVRDFSATVPRDGVIALVGANGAGKTSTLRGIAGPLRRDPARIRSGRVVFEGRDVTALGPLERHRLGIVMVPERDKVFANLSVRANLLIGARHPRSTATAERFDQALDLFPLLRPHLKRPAGLLSGGQRQMLALASALCAMPRLLVVDELTLGLSPRLVRDMTRALRTLAELGLPILMTEQRLDVAFELADMVYVLDGGRAITSGSPRTADMQEQIASAMMRRG